MERIVLQVDFPSHAFDIEYKIPQAAKTTVQHSIETLEKPMRERLLAILAKDNTIGLSKEDKEFLWEKRHYCHTHTNSLPKILASAPHWDWASLPEIYSLLQQWPPLSPLAALELLDSKFADQEVRNTAMNWIETLSDDELTDFLPQFVQALKYETYLDSALVQFLLARALGSIRIAHYLYWLLKDTLYDSKFGVRYEQILGAFFFRLWKRAEGRAGEADQTGSAFWNGSRKSQANKCIRSTGCFTKWYGTCAVIFLEEQVPFASQSQSCGKRTKY